MITEQDEFLTHQIAETHDIVAEQSPGFRDVNHFIFQDRTGDLAGVYGVGIYPNTGSMCAWLSCVHGGHQYNLRAWKDLASGRWETAVGPITFTILEPLRRIRLVVDENPVGLRCDLTFTATFPPYQNAWRPGLASFDQWGTIAGTITAGGATIAADDLVGARERSWGPGNPPRLLPRGITVWVEAAFDDFAVQVYVFEEPDGRPQYFDAAIVYRSGDILPIVRMEHRLRFDEGLPTSTGGEIVLHDQEGKAWTLGYDRYALLYMNGAGYTPELDKRHNAHRGPLHVAGETWDLATLERTGHHLRFTDVYASFTCEGKTGYGIAEIIPVEFPRYGFTRTDPWVVAGP